MDYVKQAQLAKKDSAWLSALDTKARNSALMKIAEALEQESIDDIVDREMQNIKIEVRDEKGHWKEDA